MSIIVLIFYVLYIAYGIQLILAYLHVFVKLYNALTLFKSFTCMFDFQENFLWRLFILVIRLYHIT